MSQEAQTNAEVDEAKDQLSELTVRDRHNTADLVFQMDQQQAKDFIEVWEHEEKTCTDPNNPKKNLLKFLFSLFDLDNDLHVTKAEMEDVFQALYVYLQGDYQQEEVRAKIDRIFDKKDTNKNNTLEECEFTKYVQEVDDDFLESIQRMIQHRANSA